MKVIMLADVKKVGQRGTLVTVADGYANNVLIPKKLALPATAENIKRFEREAQGRKEKVAMDATLAKNALSEIEGKTVQIKARANEKGTLFESIHAKQVAEAIHKELQVSLPEKAIGLADGPIKKLGDHRVKISVQGASANVSVEVTAV